MEKLEMKDWMVAVQSDVERLWQTLHFNSETIKMLDRMPEMRPGSTDGCSDSTVCTACSGDGCVMTVYHS